jgi:hypothetical protein
MLNALMQTGLSPYKGGVWGGVLGALRTIMDAELQARERSLNLLLSLIQGIGPARFLAIITSEPFKKWMRKIDPNVASVLEGIPNLAEVMELTQAPSEQNPATDKEVGETTDLIPPEEPTTPPAAAPILAAPVIKPITATTGALPNIPLPEPAIATIPPLPTLSLTPLPIHEIPAIMGYSFPSLRELSYLLYRGSRR